MPRTFKPPGIDRLAEVDKADCEYTDECIEIQGVVSPQGHGGWPATADYQIQCFSFAAWRPIGQAVVERKLTILRPVAPGKIPFSDFPNYSIHRIKALLSKDRTRAIFAGAEKMDGPDAQLLAVAEELQKPVIISTSRFGDLSLDRGIGRFEGKVDWNGQPIRVNLRPDEDGDLAAGLKTAETLWGAQADWKRKVDEYAVQQLLALKNDTWLDDDELPLTPEQFKSRMRLESISIQPDGSFEFWHDDGDLFFGHLIQISGSLQEGLTQADIPG